MGCVYFEQPVSVHKFCECTAEILSNKTLFYLNAHSATQDVPRVARDGANTYPWDIQ